MGQGVVGLAFPSRVASLPAFIALDAKVVAPVWGGAGRRAPAFRHITICTQKLESRAHPAAHHQEDQASNSSEQGVGARGWSKGLALPRILR
jgi:hypothetical protein